MQRALFVGALYLILFTARRKPAMVVMNGVDIAILDMDNAWANYSEALKRSESAACVSTRERYKSVAIASLDTYCRWLDRNTKLARYLMPRPGDHLDRASPNWIERRRAKTR